MTWRIETGDCRDVLRSLPAGSVHTVVTSPPYFGLRDYGTGEWEGGDPACDHVAGMARQDTERETPGGRGGSFRGGEVQFRDVCGKCGATRTDRQIGLEPTPDEFVAALVGVFREVRRVLRDDGTVWLNLGDSYASSPPGIKSAERYKTSTIGAPPGLRNGVLASETAGKLDTSRLPGVKPKDLLGIPWMVAFALRADGWYLRSDIVWSKPNPMPESVTDRPTKAHEYVFLLSKSAKYAYDADAIREDAREAEHIERYGGRYNGENPAPLDDRPRRSILGTAAGRNKRSVWTVATQPYAGAHFATFPPKLIEPCIFAGAPERACGECGAPWVRTIESARLSPAPPSGWRESGERWETIGRTSDLGGRLERRTVGFEPSCPHGDGSARGVVLDPFAGAGTTGLVALQHGREFVGIELSPEYAAMARERIETAVRLGFRAPSTGLAVSDDQPSLFDLGAS